MTYWTTAQYEKERTRLCDRNKLMLKHHRMERDSMELEHGRELRAKDERIRKIKAKNKMLKQAVEDLEETVRQLRKKNKRLRTK